MYYWTRLAWESVLKVTLFRLVVDVRSAVAAGRRSALVGAALLLGLPLGVAAAAGGSHGWLVVAALPSGVRLARRPLTLAARDRRDPSVNFPYAVTESAHHHGAWETEAMTRMKGRVLLLLTAAALVAGMVAGMLADLSPAGMFDGP